MTRSTVGIASPESPDVVRGAPWRHPGVPRVPLVDLDSRRAQLLERGVASLALVALGLRQFLHSGLTSGFALALLLVPVWIVALRHYWGARFLSALGVVALVTGYLLSKVAYPAHDISTSNRTSSTMLLLGTLCGVGVILWARRIMSDGQVGLWFGIGMLLSAALGPDRSSANPWKFAWCVPLAVIVLSLLNRGKRSVLEIVALVLLALVSVTFDSRSYFATFLLAAVLVGWQLRPRRLSRRASWGWTALLMASVSVGVYFLGTTLLVDGALGQQAQQRSVAQIDTAGSLLLGGRPELAATLALMRDRPWGFGVGVSPTPHDVQVAKQGMAAINYQPNNGYVEDFMFGGHIEVHSTFGDLWASWGLPGLALAVAVGFLVIRSLAETVAGRTASAAFAFLACWTLWNLLFSPLYAAEPTLMLTLGLGLMSRSRTANGT